MGVLKIRFSEEEKEEIKQEILKMIPSGMSNEQMADMLGTTGKTIDAYIKQLIAENRTSQKYIDKKREEKKQEERQKKKMIVLGAIREGLTKVETKARAKIDRVLLEALTNELIEERNNRRWISRKAKKRSK